MNLKRHVLVIQNTVITKWINRKIEVVIDC